MAMAQALPNDGVMRAADGTPLKVALARAERREKLKALALVLPLFAFIIFSFVLPIILMLYNAVYDPDVAENMPQTVVALKSWDGKDLPSEEVFAAFVADMKEAQKNKQTALIGKRLNYEMSGIRSKVVATGRKVGALEQPPYQRCRDRHRQGVGRSRHLGHHQALVLRLHALLHPLHARPARRAPTARSRRCRRTAPSTRASWCARWASRCSSRCSPWCSAIRWPICWPPRRRGRPRS